jgi:hypothetical protein
MASVFDGSAPRPHPYLIALIRVRVQQIVFPPRGGGDDDDGLIDLRNV